MTCDNKHFLIFFFNLMQVRLHIVDNIHTIAYNSSLINQCLITLIVLVHFNRMIIMSIEAVGRGKLVIIKGSSN